MTAKNRAGLITKLQTSLKKQYKPAPAAPGRPLMEHVLYAALLEDAPVDIADEGFAKCEQEFFDWNEVRVTSVTELAEVLSSFPAPAMTALRLKRCLQSVFESFYSFEIDHLKKENLGKAVAKFESMNGVSPFVLSYLIQHGLGGHAIPVNTSGMWIMFKTGIVNEAEAKTGKVPGLERAIPKSKAIEFSSMLHQAAVALAADPMSKQVWEVIWAVNKDAEMTAPQTQSGGKSAKRKAAAVTTQSPAEEKPKSKSTGKTALPAEKTPPAESVPAGKSSKPATAKTPTKAKPASETADAAKEPTAKPTAKSKGKSASPTATEPPVTQPKKPAESKKTADAKPATAKPAGEQKLTPGSKSSPPAKSSPAAKSTKAAPASKAPAADSAAKPAKKSPTVKASPVSADDTTKPNAPSPAKDKPAKPTSQKAEPKKAKETAPAADAENQKLTKRKPR